MKKIWILALVLLLLSLSSRQNIAEDNIPTNPEGFASSKYGEFISENCERF